MCHFRPGTGSTTRPAAVDVTVLAVSCPDLQTSGPVCSPYPSQCGLRKRASAVFLLSFLVLVVAAGSINDIFSKAGKAHQLFLADCLAARVLL